MINPGEGSDVFLPAAIAFRQLSTKQRAFLEHEFQLTSELLWGRVVAQCLDPRFFPRISDMMKTHEKAMVRGKCMSKADVASHGRTKSP